MNMIIKKFTPGYGWKFTCLIISVIFLFNTAIAAEPAGIQIDNPGKQLLAPAGVKYQWYLNGKLLQRSTQKFLKINQSGEYMVEITGENGNRRIEVILVAVIQGTIHRIYVIGDSTVATYNASSYPQTGWGQIFQLYFDNSQIEVINKSIGGRSSRSFYEEGRWTEVLNSLVSGDYVFIQFGHNDRDWTKPERYTDTAAYKNYLRIYVNDTRSKGAFPVLVSPMIMHAYRGTTLRNVFTENENDYRGSMLQVAQELDVPFVDLNMKSYNKMLEVGQEYASYFLYLGLLPGEYPNFPNGSSDGTHFQEMGALEMAKLITEGLKELESDSSIAKLTSALVPLYHVEVDMNIPDAGLHTFSGDYPAGAKVTLKTRLKNGYTFYSWEDDSSHFVSGNNLWMFTMQAHNCSYLALVKDCNDSVGGSAKFDLCGICAGGGTGISGCTNMFQSEKACNYDGTLENQVIEGISRTFVNTGTFSLPEITYAINSDSAGKYQLGMVCLATDTSYDLDVIVNDTIRINHLEVEKSPDLQIKMMELNLIQGTNEIRIVTNSSVGGIMFDQLTYYSNKLNNGQCRISGLKLLNSPELLVFPNPFVEGTKIHGTENSRYAIYNICGVMVDEGICSSGHIIGTTLQKGIYLLSVQTDNSCYTQIIQKL